MNKILLSIVVFFFVIFFGQTVSAMILPTTTFDGITISTSSVKTTYSVGDDLDTFGLVVTGAYTDIDAEGLRSDQRLAVVTDYTVEGFDSSSPVTDQVLTVKAGVYTATYTVNIFASTTTATTTPEVQPRRTSGGGRTGQVAGVSTTTEPVGQVLGESTFVFNTDLGQGMSNDDVMELQKRLTEEGVYSGPITGYFGDLTLAAVKLYQAKHGITQTGFVGILTRTSLNNNDNASLIAFVKMLIETGAIYGDKATFLKMILGF